MKIIYIDSFCWGVMHQQINACLLKMLMILYPKKVEYYSGKTSKINVEKLIPNLDEVNFHPLWVKGGYGKISIILRFALSYWNNIRLLLISRKDDIIIYNYNNPLSLFEINFLNRFLKRRVLIFCHGELEMLAAPSGYSFFMRILRRKLVRFFSANRKIQNNLWFCVLGDIIKKNLKGIMPEKHLLHFLSIDHPYIFTKRDGESSNVPNILNVGTVGEFSRRKGGDDFMELVKRMQNESNIHFSITGLIGYEINTLKKLKVGLPSNNGMEPIEDKEYNSRVSELDYILYFYPKTSYRLIASGAILDAVNHEKPIIAYGNSYFEYFFKKYGDVGYLVSNLEEMQSVLTNIILRKQVSNFNFSKIKQELTPNVMAGTLADVLKKVNG